MALTREERKLLHQKSKQPTFGSGKPDNKQGNEGDISFRKVEGSGTVEYVKQNNEWVAVASSGEMPPVRIVGGSSGGSSGGVTSHSALSGLSFDDHAQYLLIDGSRAMTADLLIGDDLFLTSVGSIINWNSGDITLTHAAGKLTFGGDGAVELDFNNHEMTNVDINSGAIDGATIGASSQSAGDFTAIGAVSAGTIVGTTIDATTDFTIGGTVITDATITDDGNFTIDANGDITLDANGADISFKDNNTNELKFTNSSGSWVIDCTTASSTFDLHANNRSVIKMKYGGVIYNNRYDTAYGTIETRTGTIASNYADYKVHTLGDKYMFTMGEADYKQNYSMLTEEYSSSSFYSSYGS